MDQLRDCQQLLILKLASRQLHRQRQAMKASVSRTVLQVTDLPAGKAESSHTRRQCSDRPSC